MIKKIAGFILFLYFFSTTYAANNNLFPEISGWKMKVNEKVYNSGNLWELIDGAAEIFLSYEMEDLHIAEYTKKDQIIRVELYKHKTEDDAYGIYTSERMPDYPQVSIGSQGYKSQGVLNFLAGNYYVKIMSAGVEEADEATIAMVAEKVESAISQPENLPATLALFPEEGKQYLSDSYVAQNFLGYSFFYHAFTVKYEKESGFQLFIIKLSSEAIQKMVDEYSKLIKEENILLKDGLYIVRDPFNGAVYFKQKENYLIGVLNTTNEEMARDYIDRVILKIN